MAFAAIALSAGLPPGLGMALAIGKSLWAQYGKLSAATAAVAETTQRLAHVVGLLDDIVERRLEAGLEGALGEVDDALDAARVAAAAAAPLAGTAGWL